MSETKAGKILWQDLTISNADEVRDFYAAVVGWEPQNENMGDYSDYSMIPPGETQASAGICHSRGVNADLPPQWLIYIGVTNIEKSIESCLALGGRLISGPRDMGSDRFCVIEDPAGAVCALYQSNQ